MTLEDFLESVAAGWIPLLWATVKAWLAKVVAWVVLQLVIAAAFRLRK
jgi:hypothetical protein